MRVLYGIIVFFALVSSRLVPMRKEKKNGWREIC